MANSLYNLAREEFLGGDLDWDTDTFKVALLSSSYTFDADHEDYNDLSGVIDTSDALASKTKVDGYADADDVSISGVSGGNTIVAIVIYQDTGTPANDRLIYFADTTATGLAISVTTDGTSPVSIPWSSSGIFRL